MIVDHERLEEDAVFFIDLPESIQQADKAVISLALCGEDLLQQGELALLDSREDILDSLKVNIESGTMDSGALYDFLYGNAPAVYSDIRSLPGVFWIITVQSVFYATLHVQALRGGSTVTV